jgi:small GTP-binding protein
MSFSVGIVGLPNVGKSTLFKALTKKEVDIADYPFTTVNPNVGVVPVPDERLEKIAEVIKPQKVTPTIIEFVDIAGLVKGAHKGEGLGNQFLAQIRNCDAIVQVVDSFRKEANPESEIETIKIELEMKDLESKEKENLLAKKPVVYVYNIKD